MGMVRDDGTIRSMYIIWIVYEYQSKAEAGSSLNIFVLPGFILLERRKAAFRSGLCPHIHSPSLKNLEGTKQYRADYI